ncbi:3-methyl-2-oxobutanoate hydroxymethyltransferase [Paenibacillus phyllosphaerae]|uniref:3-methyl-2-oxobutanoate hydroxymethyltransferase n=1 Tax=Paenibacillus phyllosphaerae TaxID=274593 RepID=A0A7W5FLQ4_9BACL|nr:3-methyl-2-oxobutanoate hydroxymethyltransferase [Paenibacillus phyllosphaerae]MBB3109318.1 3-methyl-2-oxobutanoate hydroxymethyltransferase [Paenibacillus phyllosphaerae]
MKQALTITKMKKMKQAGEPITMLTAYDYPSAKLAEEAGIDIILVGDSLGNVVLGYDTTIPVTLDDMVYHTRATVRGATNTFVVADLSFMTYRLGIETTLRNAARLMQEGLASAVKMEGGADIADEVSALVRAGIPVMGHIGLTPQSVHQLGGYKVQGKLPKEAQQLIDDAKALEAAGAFAVVLELVTEPLAERITKELSIPTIGIGAGRACDGQVLVFHDLLQYASPYREKKFVKTYADIGSTIRTAIGSYVSEVKARVFPAEQHAFGVVEPSVEISNLYGGAGSAAADPQAAQQQPEPGNEQVQEKELQHQGGVKA